MKFKKDNLTLIPVGGSEQIGMNANLYQFNEKWILVDLGIAFPDETQVGVDILLPDFEFIKKIKNKLVGIFLTHAHEDHYGALQYFIKGTWGLRPYMAQTRPSERITCIRASPNRSKHVPEATKASEN